MNATIRNIAIWLSIVLSIVTILVLLQPTGDHATPDVIPFSQLLHEADQGRIRDVLIQGSQIQGTLTDGRDFQSYAPDDPTLVQRLYGKGVSIAATRNKTMCRGLCHC
jgi:cell division protease FtsH